MLIHPTGTLGIKGECVLSGARSSWDPTQLHVLPIAILLVWETAILRHVNVSGAFSEK